MMVKVRSKSACLWWCIQNGITKPTRYWFGRWGSDKRGSHNRFAYRKFLRCGNIYKAEAVKHLPNYFECFGYEFHGSLLCQIHTADGGSDE